MKSVSETTALAWQQHLFADSSLDGRVHVSTVPRMMLFGWEDYSKNGNGFNNIISTFDGLPAAWAAINSPVAVQSPYGTLQLIDMVTLEVVARFWRQRQTDKWSLVA